MIATGHAVTHDACLTRLRRIEGQVRGIQRLVSDRAYCIDIITQVQAAQAALGAVSRQILRRHLDHCVADALQGPSPADAREKIDELMRLIAKGLS
jgi:DNA-binding FrmR family transcriptional regulator